MKRAYAVWRGELERLKGSALYREEGVLRTPQSAEIVTEDGRKLINMCSNNYLGLSGDAEVTRAAEEAVREWGYGLSSVRFICGTQSIHVELEKKISDFLYTEDTLLYSSCFDANGGLFETLTGAGDAIISDELNHASIIDGIRLSKAARYRYKNNDMADLESKLKEAEASGAAIKLIITDGVFSMDGNVANLRGICDLADSYGAVVAVDDSHATGVIGEKGRGSHEHSGVVGRVDIITGTFGKALGGASGGFTSGSRDAVELLKQRSRPYLFSNSLSPAITATTIKILDKLGADAGLKNKLAENAAFFRSALRENGLAVNDGVHPIVPVIVGSERAAREMAASLLRRGIYAVAFYYPVVPNGLARIRAQVSAAHTEGQLAAAAAAFAAAKREIGM